MAAAALFVGCEKESGPAKEIEVNGMIYLYTGTERMIVACKTHTSPDIPGEMLVVKWRSDIWRPMSVGIDGFNYQSGYEWTLSVDVYQSEHPIMDGINHHFVLDKVISKTAKSS